MRETPLRPVPEAPANPGLAYLILLAIYFGFVVYGSMVPLDYRYAPFSEAMRRVMADPVAQLRDTTSLDVQTHIFLYAPLTFLGMGFATRENTVGGRFWRALVMLVFSTLLSISVEVGQVFVCPRTACFGHWAYQCVGALVGIAAWLLLGNVITRWIRALWFDRRPRQQVVYVLGVYVVGLIAYVLLPLKVPSSPEAFFDKLDYATFYVVPFTDHASLKHMASEMAAMVPIGYLFFQLGRYGYTVGAVAVLGFLFATALSFLGIVMSSGCWSSTDVLLGTIGASAGAWLADRFGPRATKSLADKPGWGRLGKIIALAGIFGEMAAIASFKWRPYNFAMPPEGLWTRFLGEIHIPFYHQYWMDDSFEAMRNMLVQFGAFLILGLLVRSVTTVFAKGNRLVPSLLMVILAIAFEEVRLLIPNRTADLTAMVISGTGGVMGICLFGRFANVFLKTDQTDMNKAHSGEQ